MTYLEALNECVLLGMDRDSADMLIFNSEEFSQSLYGVRVTSDGIDSYEVTLDD